ncbi:hypothetical protein ACHAW5_005375 [Stephanodiscus triporus]|uniref:Uncharacterized protein n=1 Tax=Stephanodiscus triporus TaxID=2934178 RepID=A0ABD3Q4N9_9STRA
MCRHRILGCMKLPYETVVCPFFVKVREYVEHAGKPSMSGILVADRQLDHIMMVSKQVFVNFFGQTQRVVQLAEKVVEMHRSTTWMHNTAFVLFLENLGLGVFGERMLWNPLCAGTIFSTVSYVGNLYGGCAIIDCQAQLRISLYLYHGLLINGLIHE